MLEYKTAPKVQKLNTRQSSIKEFTVCLLCLWQCFERSQENYSTPKKITKNDSKYLDKWKYLHKWFFMKNIITFSERENSQNCSNMYLIVSYNSVFL